MGTFAKFKSKTQVEENVFEIVHEIYNDGACQCFGDCNCYNKKGEYICDDIRYSNGIVLNTLGKERTYNSIVGCKESLKAYLTKNK